MDSKTDLPTILVDQYRHAATNKMGNDSYKGLAIHALPGLHEFMFGKVKNHTIPNGSVLDLAAGSGAMSLRLQDAGFNVTSTDYVAENFRLHETVPFSKLI